MAGQKVISNVYNYEINMKFFAGLLEENTILLGKFLRRFTENKGKI